MNIKIELIMDDLFSIYLLEKLMKLLMRFEFVFVKFREKNNYVELKVD